MIVKKFNFKWQAHFYQKFLKQIFDFIAPRNCYHCDKIISVDTEFENRQICITCIRTLTAIDIYHTSICSVCCHPLKQINDKMFCVDCQDAEYCFGKNVSLFSNEGAAQTIMYKYKFAPLPGYANLIATLCLKHHSDYLQQWDVFVPVILSISKKHQRGFCQVTKVVEILAKKLSIPMVKVVKPKQNILWQQKAQKQKSRTERKISTYHRFVFIKSQTNYLNNKRILIFDDIFSTGATINAHAKHIKENVKPTRIGSFSFLRTFWKEDV